MVINIRVNYAHNRSYLNIITENFKIHCLKRSINEKKSVEAETDRFLNETST